MKNLFTVLFITALLSCSTQREVYVDDPHILEFGSAGGFTNQSITYSLQSDGRLWKIRGLQGDSSLLVQLKKSQTKKLFKQAYQMGLDTLEFNKPGNMNNFIRFRTKAFNNQVQWAEGAAPARLGEFYKSLIEVTKTN